MKNGLRPKARQSKTSSSRFTSQTRRRMGVTDAIVTPGLGRHDNNEALREKYSPRASFRFHDWVESVVNGLFVFFRSERFFRWGG